MDTVNLARGDNNDSLSSSPRLHDVEATKKCMDEEDLACKNENNGGANVQTFNNITPQTIDDNEVRLKERIAQCRSLIESLKHELTEEKSKIEKESKPEKPEISKLNPITEGDAKLNSDKYKKDLLENNTYSVCIDSRLNCDENLIEYEKQLQRYQNTLNMAQIEKKNAIRKQMLAKAFNLKLLEVENQCNVELLRVKQSLQCLEPLRIIASKWKTSTDDSYDLNNFELIPRYPEINSDAFSNFNKAVANLDIKMTAEKYDNNMENFENPSAEP